jgi:hypothetical protein
MASLLVPVSVVAKIVKTKTAVPSLTGAPFNTDLTLEAGIHVHWALPDALTNAAHAGQNPAQNIPPNQIIFPGVPDLWLVTRFNPPAPNSTTRTWTAWVVDSRAGTATPLNQWTAPAAPDPATVHTLPGLLPAAPQNPGWGMWNNSQTQFDAAITSNVYYPTARSRFGFYDNLAGLPASGSVSYTVVGWYSSTANDPLYQAANREQQIADWKWKYNHHLFIVDIPTPVSNTPPAAANWKPQLGLAQQSAVTLGATARMKTTLSETALSASRLTTIQAALGKAGVSQQVAAPIVRGTYASQIVCHGSVLDVPLNGSPVAASIATSQIAVYPTPKRAMATVAAPHLADQQLDYVEMMLQDVSNQNGSMGGVIDMPGAAHALTFQSIPGKPVYYAQIVISDPPPALSRVTQAQFSLVSASPVSAGLVAASNVVASGHWPETLSREALSLTSASNAISANPIIQGPTRVQPTAPPFQAAPPQPSASDIATWIANVTAAFQKTAADAAAAGTPIDPKMVRVLDSRSKAKPLQLAPLTDGSGTKGSSYWIQIDDTDALTQILTATTGASISLPDKGNLYSQPGPRWYRPWSPQIVLTDAKRSYRFGEDGRFESDGTLLCRASGYTAYAIYSNTGAQVQASALVANPTAIASVAGLPPETQSLLSEAVMLDTGSAPALAAAIPVAQRAAAQTYFSAAIQGVYLQRLSNLSAATVNLLGKIQVEGEQPSPVALTPWQDPYDPLFLDTNYSLLSSSLATDWQLQEDQVEMTPLTPAATNPPAAQTTIFNERCRVTATLTKVLEKTLVSATALNPVGVPVLRQQPPNGLTVGTFQTMDLLSAPLTGFDTALFAGGRRERDGVLRVNKLSLVDVFGIARPWDSGASTGPSIPLTPRLPFWARLSFRLQSAADQNQEANSYTPAVCGILLPDFLDHSLQVFDGSGNAIGTLSSDPPRFGAGPSDPGGAINVKFQAYPWVTAPGADPLNAIANPILRELVAGIAAQGVTIPAKAPAANWYESGLTAMLRTIDTVRATLDPSYNTPDRKVSLLGEPILVMVGRLTFQTSAATDPNQVALGPPPIATPPPVPSIFARIGDITRPDDGVLGFFAPNDSPANSRFSPVSKEAADHAILNGLTAGLAYSNPNGLAVTHPFVVNQVNVITVPPDTPRDVIMLSDIRGDLYATCGVLPRKSITVPKDFLDAALQNMEPVFPVGPVFTTATATAVNPMFPPPMVQGYDASFVYSAAGAANPFPETAMPPTSPVGDLAPGRATINEGWVRLQVHKTG